MYSYTDTHWHKYTSETCEFKQLYIAVGPCTSATMIKTITYSKLQKAEESQNGNISNEKINVFFLN